jgi:hypothetical protein
LHDEQALVHGMSQQTPSTQLPLMQSAFALHSCPRPRDGAMSGPVGPCARSAPGATPYRSGLGTPSRSAPAMSEFGVAAALRSGFWFIFQQRWSAAQ